VHVKARPLREPVADQRALWVPLGAECDRALRLALRKFP
jgi:hypothetical protein